MSPFTARLGFARERAAQFRDHVCEIVREVGDTPDDAGGTLPGAPTVIATVSCALFPHDVQAQEGVQAGAVVSARLWRVRLPALTDVVATDRVRQIDATPVRTFEVLQPGGPKSYEAERVAICREVA